MATKIALLGFGTVGQGTYEVLTQNADTIEKKTGKKIEVAAILERNLRIIKSGIAPENLFTQDFDSILNNPEIKVVAEMMGGLEPANSFMLQALKAGKCVVTPNKAAVAANYDTLHAAAAENGVQIKYEASVGGAIPVIETIHTSLVANKITKIQGIVNGTTNYILTKMEEENLSYEDALKQAQEKGFAEADPTADVEGIDSANKLTILMAEAFGVYIKPDEFERIGITNLTRDDLRLATQNNCKLKLLASAERLADGSIEAFVKPTEVPKDSPLASVRNEVNGILITCNMANNIFLSGPGAGKNPTGSAVAADIVSLA